MDTYEAPRTAERDAIECHRPEARPVGAHEAVSGEPRLWPKGVRSAQKIQVGSCIPVGCSYIRLELAQRLVQLGVVLTCASCGRVFAYSRMRSTLTMRVSTPTCREARTRVTVDHANSTRAAQNVSHTKAQRVDGPTSGSHVTLDQTQHTSLQVTLSKAHEGTGRRRTQIWITALRLMMMLFAYASARPTSPAPVAEPAAIVATSENAQRPTIEPARGAA